MEFGFRSSQFESFGSESNKQLVIRMTMKNVRDEARGLNGFSEFSKPKGSSGYKLINPNVFNSGVDGKCMFDSSESQSFYERLSKLNESNGFNLVFDVRHTKLNLHMFYKEVTLRGGFSQVNKDRRWDEVACSLKLDGRNLNYQDILLKLYALFLFQYEQIYFYRGPEKSASMPDITKDGEISPQMEMKCTNQASEMVTSNGEEPGEKKMLKESCSDTKDSPQMEMKCTNDSSQMITSIEDEPGRKNMLKESCGSQSISTGSPSAEKQSTPEAEQNLNPQLQSEKEEILTNNSAPAEIKPAVTEVVEEQTTELQTKKKQKNKRGAPSAEKEAAPKKKCTRKPGLRQGLRSGYHIFIKTECDRLKLIPSNRSENLRHMANDAWNRLSDAEKQPWNEQSNKENEQKRKEREQIIKEKESSTNIMVVDVEQTHVKECADPENKPCFPDGDTQVILNPTDSDKSIQVD